MYNIGPTSAQLNADGKLNLVFSAARRRQGTLLSAVANCFMTLILSAAAAGAFATGNSGWSLLAYYGIGLIFQAPFYYRTIDPCSRFGN